MKIIWVVLAVLLVIGLLVSSLSCSKKNPTAPPSGAVVFQDNFDSQSSMSNWHHTQDYRGGGAFEVVNGQFLRTTVGHVFYYNDTFSHGAGTYEFKARGQWAFFWRGMTHTDSMYGKVLEIQNNQGSLEYIESNWWGYDHGFHNGSASKRTSVSIGQELTNNLNQFKIVDNGQTAQIYMNSQLKLTETISSDFRNAGYVEIGANHLADTTAFDDIVIRQ